MHNYVRISLLALFVFASGCANSSPDSTPSTDRLTSELSKSTSSDLQTVLMLTAWVYSAVGPVEEEPDPVSPEHMLTMLAGACGIRDMTLQTVLNRLGFETRRVSFFDVPVQVGHTATEVFVDGKWIFIDASIGGYWAANSDLNTPLSLAEARAAAPAVQMMITTLTPWQKHWVDFSEVATAYEASTLFAPYSQNTIEHPYQPGRIVFYIEETYITSIYTNLDHPEAIFTIPINLDSNPTGQIGTRDGDYEDLTYVVFDLYGQDFYDAGLWFIGSYLDRYKGIIEPVHKFSFSTSGSRSVTMRVNFVEATNAISSLLLVESTTASPHVTWQGNTAIITFTATNPSTDIEVSLASGPWLHTIDSISWQ